MFMLELIKDFNFMKVKKIVLISNQDFDSGIYLKEVTISTSVKMKKNNINEKSLLRQL